MDEYDDIIEKIRNSLENKKGLEIKECYFLIKKMEQIYLDEIIGDEVLEDQDDNDDILDDDEDDASISGGSEPDDEDDYDDEKDVVQEEEPEPIEEFEEEPKKDKPKAYPTILKRKPLIKRPMIVIKKNG